MSRPAYKQIRLDLLEQLSKHVRDGALGHKVFDFNVVNGNLLVDAPPPVNKCGTNGCAMGELPIIFPERWRFNEAADVALFPGELATLRDDGQDLPGQVAHFFGLWRDEVWALFFPRAGAPMLTPEELEKYGQPPSGWTAFHCQKLPPTATRTMVADNLDAFIAYHKANP